ncbi:MAG: glycosyltransferase [Lachnospiraceae bacterium]|nr:glycosyltransferase [Lachnospiraceae bacterium]
MNGKDTEKPVLMLITPMLHQGGFERVAVQTARLMAPYFRVFILIFSDRDIAYDVTGIEIVNIHMDVKKGKLFKILNMFRRSRAVAKVRKQRRPDFVYSFGPSANLVNVFSSGKGRGKTVLGLRNYTDAEEGFRMKLFVKKADLIISCSEPIDRKIRADYGAKKTGVLYNMADVDRIRKESLEGEPELPWGDDKRILLSVGREADQKAFWYMIKAFSLIHKACPDTVLMIIGAGRYTDYRKLASDLGLSDCVYFTGVTKVPYRYVKKGSVYLQTSLSEGFPNALVEAMALGLPCVCCNCMTGPAEILSRYEDYGKDEVIYGEYGILTPPITEEKNLDPEIITDPEKLYAETVTGLLTDDNMMREYGEKAAKRSEDFSNSAYTEGLCRLLK